MNRKKLVITLLVVAATMLVSAVALAADVDPNTAATAKADVSKWAALAAGLAIGIAALGGALGQGRAAAAALDGIARNPSAADKLFTPMILGLAFVESLVIFALLIAFTLATK
jgi:F-type H+-transporting ATPase subunit c